MANSIEEALQEAINVLLQKGHVKAVAYHQLPASEEKRPCNFVAKLLDVMHKEKNGYTFSHKSVYIDTVEFKYYWHYGGSELEDASTPFKDLLESKLNSIKANLNLDFIQIDEANENNESGILFAVQSDGSPNNAYTYKIKVWKINDNNINYKIISKTIVE